LVAHHPHGPPHVQRIAHQKTRIEVLRLHDPAGFADVFTGGAGDGLYEDIPLLF